jgi:quinol-cytochrome oxidoreductase complex cytochrome b subunit
VTPIILLLIVPFLDRGEDRDPRSRLIFIIAFLVGLTILFALTIVAALTGPAEHLGG